MAEIVSAIFAGAQCLLPVCKPVAAHAGYISKFDDNLNELRSALRDLEAKRADVVRKVDAEELKGRRRTDEVERWLSRVQTIENNTNLLVADASAVQQRRSTCGCCSNNIISTYRCGKKIPKMLSEVQKLFSEVISEVTRQATLRVVEEEPFQQTFFGLDTKLRSTWSLLMEDGTRMLGLYGMGGVGKTTLLTLIENKFVEVKGDFDVVIWVKVSKDVDIGKIQDDIGKRLGLYDENWCQKTQREKRGEIHRVLKDTKPRFVLLLDDLWTEVSFLKIGIPVRGKEYKIVFTTRFKNLCESMRANKVIEVEPLAEEDALDLLMQNAGRDALDGEMLEHAKNIVEKCLGLPLALEVIGKSLLSKTTADEWHRVLCTNLEGVGDEIFPVLKYSYDNLEEGAKLCLKYCALFPEAYKIREDELVEYWIGEGIIDEEDGRTRAMDRGRGYHIIGTLVGAGLLVVDDESTQKVYMHGLICESRQKVYMHGLIREMALWIVVGCGERFLVKTGAGLSKLPKVKNWRIVTKMSLMNNEIESITDYSHFPNPDRLVTLFLQNNKLVDIVGKFFLVLSTLVVLDLSRNPGITELPDDISKLVSLWYLNLLGTRIKNLQGLNDLIELIHLDLESTSNLQSIDLISRLLKLQVLRFCDSKASLDLPLLKQLERLEDLEFLTITVREEDVLEAFKGSKLAGKTHGLYLEGLTVPVASIAATFGELGSHSKLGMTDCDITESGTKRGGNRRDQHSPCTSSNQITPSNTCFKNLSAVVLLSCEHLMDVTWLIHAANLESLSITLSPKMEEVISEEKARDVGVEPFLKLQVLDLGYLDKLKSIYWSPLSFPRLQKIRIRACPELRKLPLNSTSVEKIDDLIIEMDDGWLDRIEWESGAEDRFRHVIRTASVSQLHPV